MRIRYATESDASDLAHVNIQSFHRQEFWRNAFPGLDSATTLPLKRVRCLEKLAQPQTHVLAAVDDTGRVLGYARWFIPESPPLNTAASNEGGVQRVNVVELSPSAAAEVERGGMLPKGARREVYEAFFDLLKEKSREYLRADDIVLEFLATLPSAQGQGVGTALLRWGIEQAERRGRRIYLEATTEGFPLYRKLGWEALAEAEIDYSRYGGEGSQVLVLMIRSLSPPHGGVD